MKIYVFGNLINNNDHFAPSLIPELSRQFPEIQFIHADPTENWWQGEKELVILDTVVEIDKVTAFNSLDAFQKQTALMWASAEGHLDVVDTLIKAGADPNLKAHVTSLTERKNADHPTGGFTALMWAARNGHDEVVRRLVQGGADLKLKNGDGASATMVAIYNDRFDIAALLVELGADANDGSLYTFMDNVNFEQAGLPVAKIGTLMQFLTENMEVEGLYLNDRFFNIHLPANIVMTVTETEEGVKGNTVSNVMKPAKVNTGLEIKVPLFINQGDRVRVDTRNFAYIERFTEPKK